MQKEKNQLQADIAAAVGALERTTRGFLSAQRARLLARHEGVEREMRRQRARRRAAVRRQRRLFLRMQNAAAPAGFTSLGADFTVTLLLGLHRFDTTLGVLRTRYPRSRLEILFSGRHLVGMLQRTHGYFFDRPCTSAAARGTMLEILSQRDDRDRDDDDDDDDDPEAPATGPDAHLWDYFCAPLTGREHLDYHLIDVEACVEIPSKAGEEDRDQPLPRVEMVVAAPPSAAAAARRTESNNGGHHELIAFAEDIAARSDAIFNSVAVRFSENLAYLERREAAICRENARLDGIEQHFARAEEAWRIECETHREFRTHLETAIVVNMGESGTQYLTTTHTLTTVQGSKLADMCGWARKTALREKTERRWNVETVSFPLESPIAVRSFKQMIDHLRLSWPSAPPMPAGQQARIDLWRAAARFGILTEAWMSWLEDLTSEEQWQLHYEDLTFGNSLMGTLDQTTLKKPLQGVILGGDGTATAATAATAAATAAVATKEDSARGGQKNGSQRTQIKAEQSRINIRK
jgi:hypothetical protein